MSEHHTILGGKVHIYRRPNSSSWQCASYLAGRNRRTTTKEDSLSKAKEFAEDWYLQLRGKLRCGELKSGKLFREAAELYLREFDIITQGQRSPTHAHGQHARTNGHLIPFFGSMVLPEITAARSTDTVSIGLKKATLCAANRQRITPRTRKSSRCARFSKRLCGTDGSTIYRICQNHIARRLRFSIEHGSHRKSTSSFTMPRENARMILSSPVFVGKRNNFTTMFCSPPILASVPTRRCVFSFATSR